MPYARPLGTRASSHPRQMTASGDSLYKAPAQRRLKAVEQAGLLIGAFLTNDKPTRAQNIHIWDRWAVRPSIQPGVHNGGSARGLLSERRLHSAMGVNRGCAGASAPGASETSRQAVRKSGRRGYMILRCTVPAARRRRSWLEIVG